jgi:gamma-glutamyltranspeptidase/glutathione hydrolase
MACNQLLQSLNTLEHFPLAEYGHNTERGLHTICEVLKRASADRVTWRNSGKAEELLLDKGYAASRAAEIGDEATP